jgi:SOS response regulatory protein OraA/RecX
MALEEAMKKAIEYCIGHNILSGFLKKHGSEVFNMLLTEWNIDDAKEIWQEEAREEGMEIILNLVRQGYTAEQIEKILAGETSSRS